MTVHSRPCVIWAMRIIWPNELLINQNSIKIENDGFY